MEVLVWGVGTFNTVSEWIDVDYLFKLNSFGSNDHTPEGIQYIFVDSNLSTAIVVMMMMIIH